MCVKRGKSAGIDKKVVATEPLIGFATRSSMEFKLASEQPRIESYMMRDLHASPSWAHASDVFYFCVGIRPMPKDRPRAGLIRKGMGYACDRSGRPIITFRSTERSKEFEAGLKFSVRTQMQASNIKQKFPLEGPLAISFVFYVPRPEAGKIGSKAVMPAVRGMPDLDNFEKAAMDALNGLMYKDDSQVVRKWSEKIIVDHRREERVVITVSELMKKEENHI